MRLGASGRTRLLIVFVVVAVVGLGVWLQSRVGASGQSLPSALGGYRGLANNQPTSAALVAAQGAPAPSGIVVTGTGSTRVSPDVAFVTVGVQSRGNTAREAQDANNATMSAVINQIKALGIAEQDIQTSGISLSAVVEQNNQITGYQATNTVTVRVLDINQAGPVLDAAVAAGANVAGSVRFGVKDPGPAHQAALDAAAKDARSKADAVARALGVQIQSVESAVEEGTGEPSPVQADGAARSLAAAPVQPGEMVVSAQLRVTYGY